jgi:hypothetical protein
MGLLPVSWVCPGCGQASGAGVARGVSGLCEPCAELSAVETLRASGEVLRRGAIARLRAYYSAARGLVGAGDPGDPHHVHLEGILGTGSDPDRDDAGLESGIPELMVLWLEDLASDLEGTVVVPRARKSPGARPSVDDRLESAARGLRAATRDFAVAFGSERASAEGCP